MLVGLVFLVVVAAYSVYRWDFQFLQTLWVVLAAPFGAIIGCYFRGNETTWQENHQRKAQALKPVR
jgi:hypothetical protein